MEKALWHPLLVFKQILFCVRMAQQGWQSQRYAWEKNSVHVFCSNASLRACRFLVTNADVWYLDILKWRRVQCIGTGYSWHLWDVCFDWTQFESNSPCNGFKSIISSHSVIGGWFSWLTNLFCTQKNEEKSLASIKSHSWRRQTYAMAIVSVILLCVCVRLRHGLCSS